jgi:hypothetical protein
VSYLNLPADAAPALVLAKVAAVAREMEQDWLARMQPDAPPLPSAGMLIGELAADVSTLAHMVGRLVEIERARL